MAKPLAKKKKKNVAGRKNPAFYQTIMNIVKDSMMSADELNEKQRAKDPEFQPKLDDLGRMVFDMKNLPEGCTAIDTLNGHYVFNDARMMRHIELMAVILQEFDDEFWTEHGSSIMDLRRDRKNRTWGDELSVLTLCYVAIAMDLAHWSYPRLQWTSLPGGMPYIKFTGPRRGEIEEAETSEQIKERLNKGESNGEKTTNPNPQ